ncbi:MAG: class II fumarate hydratase [Gammaproteobacteria bacterium]|nr:class II fumarate hydratase [Gammaproteobacteria bacterium]
MNKSRIERDSMGEVKVPTTALYGAQTQRAINNFNASGQPMPKRFVTALLDIKACAALANQELQQISTDMTDAINKAVESLKSKKDLMTHFPVDVYQTGSGTSSNMNANEVIATLANRILEEKGSQDRVGANDHVNYGQSSNDIIPTTIHVSSAIGLERDLIPALEYLSSIIDSKSSQLEGIVKTGRTHLMDAMPIRMTQVLDAWRGQIELSIKRIRNIQPQLQTLALGGTAVGTGINAHPEFSRTFNKFLEQRTGIAFRSAKNFFTHIGSQDIAVALSGELKALAIAIMKISNDLRWMNSGPLAGLGEITLEALQPGSSIMPGKVNPVAPEAAAMAVARVIGNDSTIAVAGQSGNFALNVMLPVIGDSLLQSIRLLSNVSRLLADKAILSFQVNENKLAESLNRNPILVTALNPIVGYEKAASIAKKAYQEKRAIVDVAHENTELSRSELEDLLDPRKLADGGIK